MSTRVTRGSAATKSSSLGSDKENNVLLPSPPATYVPVKRNTASDKKPIEKIETPKKTSKSKASAKSIGKTNSSTKRAAPNKKSSKAKTQEDDAQMPVKAGSKRKRTTSPKDEQEYDELPHNMGRVARAKKTQVKEELTGEEETSPKKRPMKNTAVKKEDINSTGKAAFFADSPQKKTPRKETEKATKDGSPPIKKPKTPKANPYGLTPGVSPFPDYPHPTPDECEEVTEILKAHHPEVQGRPNTIPPPSEIVAGCGQVPSILDALIRTRLSAATTGDNSSNAYKGMVARYGNRETGVGKGSVDYNAVRLAPQEDLFNAIKCGGLADSKSKDIKTILDMVYEENQGRRRAHLQSRAAKNEAAGPQGASYETDAQKDAEIALAEGNILSLDHYYSLPTYDAIYTFVKYPGIGVKTAACVAMFCMQRDCFAVDTHVFRLCQWLGWVPPDNKKVGRDTTFSHLEVRIPDHLKFDLHQLFIKHGKTCPRCRAATGENSQAWAEGCVIDHLVTRTGVRKGGPNPVKKAGKAGKGKEKFDADAEDDDEEMPDLDDVDEESTSESPTKKKSSSTKSSTPKTKASAQKGPSKRTALAKAVPSKTGTPARSSAKKARMAMEKALQDEDEETANP